MRRFGICGAPPPPEKRIKMACSTPRKRNANHIQYSGNKKLRFVNDEATFRKGVG